MQLVYLHIETTKLSVDLDASVFTKRSRSTSKSMFLSDAIGSPKSIDMVSTKLETSKATNGEDLSKMSPNEDELKISTKNGNISPYTYSQNHSTSDSCN